MDSTLIFEMMKVLLREGEVEKIKPMMESLLNTLLEIEREQFIGVDRYHRSKHRNGVRNGYKPRTLKTTRFGSLELLLPQADSTKRAEMDSAPTVHAGNKTTIPNIIQSFKRHTTIKYIRGVKNNGWTPFNKKLWQRNYWEHIIRNENEYNRIAQYIVDNPLKWKNDKLNGGIGNIVMEQRTEYNSEIWMI